MCLPGGTAALHLGNRSAAKAFRDLFSYSYVLDVAGAWITWTC